MIGKQEWFKRRKYGGWGLYPAAWQGWVYIAVFIALTFGIQYAPIGQTAKMIATVVLAGILFVDAMHIMITMKKDERDTLHEALAERNALWAIVFVLAGGAAYQAAQGIASANSITIDPIIIAAIIIGLAVKAISNFYLDKHN